MDIFVDENIPTISVEALRKAGHDVKDIRGTKDEGIPDDEMWRLTQSERRLLVTTDKGFSKSKSASPGRPYCTFEKTKPAKDTRTSDWHHGSN